MLHMACLELSEREMYYRWWYLSKTGSSGLSLGRRYLRVLLTLCLGLHWPAWLSPKIELCSGSSRHRASCRGTFWVRKSFSRMNGIILHTRAGFLTREKRVFRVAGIHAVSLAAEARTAQCGQPGRVDYSGNQRWSPGGRREELRRPDCWRVG